MNIWQYRFDKLIVRLPNYFDYLYTIVFCFKAVGNNKDTAPNDGNGYTAINVSGHATSPNALPRDFGNVRCSMKSAFKMYMYDNEVVNPQDGYKALEEFLTNFDTIVTNPLLWQWKEEKPNPVYESNNVVVYSS